MTKEEEPTPRQKLEESIFSAFKKIKKESRDRRISLLIGTMITLFLILHHVDVYHISIWLVIVLWIVAILCFLVAIGSDVSEAKDEYEKLQYRKDLLYGSGGGASEPQTHFDSLVNINIENLAEYYRLVKVHTEKSFNASLLVAFGGFFLITAGLVISYQSDEYKNLTYLATASGILIEFIAASFFYLYSKSVRQLKGYHDSLIDVQNMLLSFRLIDTSDSPEGKTKLVEKMIDYLASNKKA
jgi:Ca2+/Na+ antiporter